MKILILFCVLFIGGDLFAKKVIRVGEDSYYLAKEEFDGRRSTTREFVRPSESIPGWTTLIRIQELYREDSAKKYVDELARKRKLTYPTLPFEIFNKVGTDEWGIDYLLVLVLPHNQQQFVYWEYFYVKKNPENKGIVVNQFICKKSLEEFLNGCSPEDVETGETYRHEMIFVLRTNEFIIEEGATAGKGSSK